MRGSAAMILRNSCSVERFRSEVAYRKFSLVATYRPRMVPELSFSLRRLCDLCVSAVNMPREEITAETQRTQRKRGGLKLGVYPTAN